MTGVKGNKPNITLVEIDDTITIKVDLKYIKSKNICELDPVMTF